MNDQQKQITDRLVAMGVIMDAEFTPWSKRPKTLGGAWREDPEGLCWSVAIQREDCRETIETPYFMGIGHLPAGFRKALNLVHGRRTVWQAERVREMIETGRSMVDNHVYKVEPPLMVDVVYSLMMDGTAWFDGDTFEDWASEFGYDEDSRAAERVFQACRQVGVSLSRMFTVAEIEDLRELFQDY